MQTVDNFLDSLKSERTKEQYAYHLKRFTRYEKASDNTPDTHVISYLMAMKNEGLSSSYRNVALAAIKHYYEMNDILLNWKKISRFIGEQKFDNQIRGYIHEEIQKLVFVADVKYKCVILTLCSTGMRREALVQINPIKDMVYLDDYKLYKIRIYRNTKWEQVCFTTPEAANAINLHMQTRNRGYMVYQCLMHFGNSPWRRFKVTMTEQERKGQLEKLVREITSLQNAMKAKDPSLARGVYSDKDMKWMCTDCPYLKECEQMRAAGAAA